MGPKPSKPEIPDSFADRQKALTKSISGAFASEVKKQALDVEFTGIGFMDVDCRTKLSKGCQDCLRGFYSAQWLSNPLNLQKKKALMGKECQTPCTDACETCIKKYIGQISQVGANSPQILQIRQQQCRGQCTCSIKDVNNTSDITLNSITKEQVGEVDAQKVADTVLAEMKKQYGDSGTMDPNNLYQLVVNIQTSMIQKIKQTLHSAQMVTLEGPGVDVSGINQNVIIDATMQAVAATCSEDNQEAGGGGGAGCTITDLNKLVQDQVDEVQRQVDKSFGTNLSKVWQSSKGYVITTGLFLLFLLICILVLMVRNAWKKTTRR